MTVINIKNVSKKFGSVQALQDVSFDVPMHSIYGLLGPNGAGKTTLFSIIADFLKPQAGTVDVLGIANHETSQLQGRLSILPQDAQFQRNIPILEQLMFFQRLAGKTIEQANEDVLAVLAKVGLDGVAKRRARTLSHGMFKRLGIAQAFLGEPEVILLDEPTAGLDPANARQIRDLIKELQKQATIVVSSHNMDEIQELCDHVAILAKGKLIQSSSVQDIVRSHCEFNLHLPRVLEEAELDRINAIADVGKVVCKTNSEALGSQSIHYSIMFELSEGSDAQDRAVEELLRTVLDMGCVPHKFSQGRNLEAHFLDVTGEH